MTRPLGPTMSNALRECKGWTVTTPTFSCRAKTYVPSGPNGDYRNLLLINVSETLETNKGWSSPSRTSYLK